MDALTELRIEAATEDVMHWFTEAVQHNTLTPEELRAAVQRRIFQLLTTMKQPTTDGIANEVAEAVKRLEKH